MYRKTYIDVPEKQAPPDTSYYNGLLRTLNRTLDPKSGKKSGDGVDWVVWGSGSDEIFWHVPSHKWSSRLSYPGCQFYAESV